MKSKKDKETIIPEIDLATNMCYAMLEQMQQNREVHVEDVDNIMDMACSMVRIAMNQGQRELDKKHGEESVEAPQQTEAAVEKLTDTNSDEWKKKYQEIHDRLEKKLPKKGKHESKEDKIVKACNAVDKFFHACVMMETFFAKQEERPVSMKKLQKDALRITKACFKDIEGVDLNNITAEIHKDNKEITVSVLMPKDDEE